MFARSARMLVAGDAELLGPETDAPVTDGGITYDASA
jgi:hypothetical protein